MRYFRIILLIVLLMGGAILCAVRWKAWFGNPEEPQWLNDTLAYRFSTYTTDSLARPDSVRILLLGDIHSTLHREDYEKIVARDSNLTAYAQLGDFMERSYTYYAQELVHELDSTQLYTLPLINCPGNHEYHKGIKKELAPLWYEMFPQPTNGPQDFIGSTYYIDFPNLRYIVLNTTELTLLHDYTRVVTWLRETLHQSGDRFTVVMMHHPVFSSAEGRFNPLIFLFFYRTLSEANMVFAGHDHNYTRNLPFVNLSSVTTRSRKVVSIRKPEVSAEGAFYGILEADNSTLKLHVYTIEDGTEIDTVTLLK